MVFVFYKLQQITWRMNGECGNENNLKTKKNFKNLYKTFQSGNSFYHSGASV